MTDTGSIQPPFISSGLGFAFGEPGVSGRIRCRPEDFVVSEIAAVVPDGDGEHLLLEVRKTGANTDWVAARLAQALGVSRRDVSFAGRKDRHAVTTQWFSVRLPGKEPEDWTAGLPGSIEVLEVHRHRRKLRRGALAGNHFIITLRDLEGETGALLDRSEHLRSEGVPNYFGEQRFGHAGRNLEAAAEMFSRDARRMRRDRRELLLSAARSHIFNEVLTRRVVDASWNRLLPGDVAGLAGSRSVFAIDDVDEVLSSRAASHDIHPTGPLWGRGDLRTRGQVAELESGVAARNPVFAEGLAATGMQHARRNLRLSVPDLGIDISGKKAVLEFSLVPGGYATVVLRELIKYEDASRFDKRQVTESVT